MEINILKEDKCLVFLQNGSLEGFTSIYIVGWNSYTFQSVIATDSGKNIEVYRINNGGKILRLTNVIAGNGYAINILYL